MRSRCLPAPWTKEIRLRKRSCPCGRDRRDRTLSLCSCGDVWGRDGTIRGLGRASGK
ncbi:hypothetical protein [Azospirillum doebereinerae]